MPDCRGARFRAAVRRVALFGVVCAFRAAWFRWDNPLLHESLGYPTASQRTALCAVPARPLQFPVSTAAAASLDASAPRWPLRLLFKRSSVATASQVPSQRRDGRKGFLRRDGQTGAGMSADGPAVPEVKGSSAAPRPTPPPLTAGVPRLLQREAPP